MSQEMTKDVLNPDNKDGLTLLYESLEEKLIELSYRIRKASIILDDKDDKTFDRLLKAMVESKSIAENQLWLKVQLGLVSKDELNKKSKNPLEDRAK